MITQYGAIPYRLSAGELEILLITSRETQRWLIPRGNAIRGLRPHKAAAREAFEEGGVKGKINRKMLGHYRYRKRQKDGSLSPAKVKVFPLLVTSEAKLWPEKRERKRDWFTLVAAAGLVKETGLRRLILRLGEVVLLPQPDGGGAEAKSP